jgi:RNA polymerase sigma factor (sigma-70 family)
MGSRFATTRWSVVLAAQGGEDTKSRLALECLCHAYWYPLYTYARNRGFDSEQARDVTQAFFVDLIQRKALLGLDPDRGRFRAFLLASARNFYSHQRSRELALRRGGGVRTVSIDADEAERRFDQEPAAELTPEELFERRWGLTVMERAMARLKAQAEGGRNPTLFEALKPYLTGGDEACYSEVAEDLSMTVGAVKVAVHRLRQRYGKVLREEIAATVVDPSQVDDELRYLLTTIRPWQA